MRCTLLALFIAICGIWTQGESTEEYDIIVVGSGLVGSAVSSRLADLLPTKKILVLEGGGGGQWPRGQQPPGHWNWTRKAFDQWPGQWHGMTRYDVPGNYGIFAASASAERLGLNSYVAGAGDHSWPSSMTGTLYCAKIRGGGGTINGALKQRVWEGMYQGHPEFGLLPWPEGWDAASMEPHFQEVESLFSLTPTPSANGKHYLQESGPSSLKDVLATRAPCNLSSEPCAAYPTGFKMQTEGKPASGSMGIPQVTAFGGIRQTTATLLQPKAMSSQNYELRLEAEVTSILHSDGVAVGVHYKQPGSETTVNLAKGGLVLLSAGAVGSPRLLLSSGIGDPSIVGKNLSDHSMTKQAFNKTGWNVSAFSFPPSEDVLNAYITEQIGPLAQYGPVWTAFVRDPTTPGAPEEYDVEIFINPSAVDNEIHVWYVLMRPTCSSLSLKWNGTALLYEDWQLSFACARDIQTMQYARDVVTARMEASGARCFEKSGDVCGRIATPGNTTLHTNIYTINHFAGTCPLGTCVNAKTLRVHGSKNVAVADASILPGQVWGHPAMTLEALAFRAAELLAASLKPDNATRLFV